MATARRRRFSGSLPAGDRTVHLRRASRRDRKALLDLYATLYGADYPLEIVKDPGALEHCLVGQDYLWVVMDADGTLIGSVLFALDPVNGMCKVFGAVILPDWQGHDLMRQAIASGLEFLEHEGTGWEVAYATTRTVSPAPERLVRRLGFKTLGIFPNVRRVRRFETHGLNVLLGKEALRKRLRHPLLVPELQEFHAIARELCGLDDEPVIEAVSTTFQGPLALDFQLIRDESTVRQRFDAAVSAGRLRFSFFPFHEPHVQILSGDGRSEVFLHHNRWDNYGCILGVRTPLPDTAEFLHAICEAASALGLKYIELLVSAFDPWKQQQALDARFLPCAYFPAMKPVEGGKRMDYLVFSRSFEQLDFTDLCLSTDGQRFLDAFMRIWYRRQKAAEPDFDRWDPFDGH